jgi:hypothetical protein
MEPTPESYIQNIPSRSLKPLNGQTTETVTVVYQADGSQVTTTTVTTPDKAIDNSQLWLRRLQQEERPP